MTSEDSPRNAKSRRKKQDHDMPRHVGNQLIVKLKPEFSANQGTRQQVLQSLPVESTVDRDFDETGVAVINLPEAANLQQVAREIENHQAVEYAEPNFIDSGTSE
jgi:hypothetical protein